MDYNFFDYKYHIDYHSEDYNNGYHTFYTLFALISGILLGFIFRKAKKEKMTLYLKIISVVMIVLEIAKVTWESYWDVKEGHGLNVGSFNSSGILSLETCSLFMYASVVAGYTKSDKVRRCCVDWLCGLGVVGGLSNIFVTQGLKWYPFWTFGAFHSMIYHYVMFLTAMLLVFNRYYDFEFKDILRGFLVHTIFSAVVITVDYITTWNYMLYRDPGAFPIVSTICQKFTDNGQYYINTIIVFIMFFLLHALFISLYIGIYALIDCLKKVITKRKQIA